MQQRQLVGSCLQAVALGAYLPDWEFHALMGMSRDEVCELASEWPTAMGGDTFMAVNNALNNLLGYPHGQWSELTGVLGADQHAVADALATWRAEDRPAGSGSSYVDFLM
jgi:hypothetical protein